MKINNLYINSLFSDSKSEIFKDGAILEGEIIELQEEEALIYIKDFGRIKAFVETELTEFKGKEINFLVKSTLSSSIQLKPFLKSTEKDVIPETTQNEEAYLVQVLNEYGVKEDPISIEYLRNLIKYNVQINEKNILSGIKIINKLEELIDLDYDLNTLINLRERPNFLKEDIRNLFIIPNKEGGNKLNFGELLRDKDLSQMERVINTDEKNIISKSETNDRKTKFFSALEDLKLYIRYDNEVTKGFKITKIVALFVKYNIKASINNLKNIVQLREDPNLFQEGFKFLEHIGDEKFTNIDKNTMINNVSVKNIIEENYIRYKISINETNDYIKENLSLFNNSTREKAEEFQNKLEFLEEINQELNFIYIPIAIERDTYRGAITFLKDSKKKNKPKDKINIFINLNTNTLGNLKISCEVIGDIINIKFSGLNKEDITLFSNRENDLKTAILSTGYILGNLEYIVDKEDDFLDLLTVNRDPIYYLDVQV